MNLAQLKLMFVNGGARKLYAKPLSENDNSKNQVYFGPDFKSLNLFPNSGVAPDGRSSNPIFKAKINFGWLTDKGTIVQAPGAQLILYPQYPEVRFSGFLKGCEEPPSGLMTGRIPDRILFLAVTANRQIIGYVAGGSTEIVEDFRSSGFYALPGVFVELSLPAIPDNTDSRSILLSELHRINRLGWIDSKQLDSNGSLMPCNAPQCGGFTLEAELGISKNSDAEPDFLGWEIKQHAVSNFLRPDSGTAITLMTPEPTGGFYKDKGVEAFIRKYGYEDKKGRPDRLNFGGIHRVGERQASTGLKMFLTGYDFEKGKILDATGSIALVSDSGEVAAEWAFSGLLEHWSRKHTKAAYVPSIRRTEPKWQYAYGSRIRLAQMTDGLRLIRAMACGMVYYDPGIKLEESSTEKPRVKRRSQFRIASKNIATLYEVFEFVDV